MPKLTAKTLTAAVIEQSKPAAKPFELRDAARPGMSLIVHPSGVRTWAFGYRIDGRWKKITFGRYSSNPERGLTLAAARERAANMRAKVAEGQDPAEEVKVKARGHADFVEDVWDDKLEPRSKSKGYLARHLEAKAKASSIAKFKRIFEKQVLPNWKNRRIDTIEKRDVLDIIDEATARGPHAANSVVTVLSSFFGWCLSRDIIKISPMAGIKKPTKETPRERALSDEELRAVWKGCDDNSVNPAFAALVRLLILTGCRRGEVAGMEWSELDLANRLWTIPSGRVKNGSTHRVHLTDAMLEIIEYMPRVQDCKYVLTTRDNAPLSGFSKLKTFLDKAAQVDNWTLHDTRRTVASGLARLGVALATVEKVLNHTSGSFGGIVGTYQTYNFAPEMQAAWELWSDHITAVLAGKKSNVVPIKTRGPGVVV